MGVRVSWILRDECGQLCSGGDKLVCQAVDMHQRDKRARISRGFNVGP